MSQAELDLPPEGPWDDKIKGFVVRVTDDWIVSVHPMMFNHRICLSRVDEYPLAYSRGWCYPDFGRAMVEAVTWDEPGLDTEPEGFIKRAGEQL